jgi:hypothetical protein
MQSTTTLFGTSKRLRELYHIQPAKWSSELNST